MDRRQLKELFQGLFTLCFLCSSVGAEEISGRWGTLMISEVVLKAPERNIAPVYFREENRWIFPGMDRVRAEGLLASEGLGEENREYLLQNGFWSESSQGSQVLLPQEMLVSLDSDQRSRINSQFSDVRLTVYGDWVYEKIRREFGDEMVGHVRELEYQLKGVRKVSNLGLIHQDLPKDDRVRLLRTLLGCPALMARLRVDAAGFESMVDYWHVPGRNDEILQVFAMWREELLSEEGVDLAHFFPSVPKQLFNRFPELSDANKKSGPDCMWTAMNFFEPVPSQRHLDGYSLSHYLDHQFEEVTGEAIQFGDLVILLGEDEEFVHAYVQVVEDDLVFTKNGRGLGFPWALMRRDSMMSSYGPISDFQVRRYRALD